MSGVSHAWTSLEHALRRRHEAVRETRFWLRDDDAVVPTGQLDRLLKLGATYAVPLTLAVIPRETDARLADGLADAPLADVVVHGWSHENHAPPTEKKQELGAHRPRQQVLEELGAGLSKLSDLHGARLAPVLVPPWNRIASDLLDGLPPLGFRALSVFGRPRPGPLPMINATVDIMDWHGTRGCRPHADILGDIVAALAEDQPVGLLTHHLVHDASAWAFLDQLFAATASSPGTRWVGIRELMAAT